MSELLFIKICINFKQYFNLKIKTIIRMSKVIIKNSIPRSNPDHIYDQNVVCEDCT